MASHTDHHVSSFFFGYTTFCFMNTELPANSAITHTWMKLTKYGFSPSGTARPSRTWQPTLDRTSALTPGGHLIQKNHQQKHKHAQNVALNRLWEAHLLIRESPDKKAEGRLVQPQLGPVGQGTQMFLGGQGLCSAACGILAPWPGIEPVPHEGEAQS